jgi:hypothetical protein
MTSWKESDKQSILSFIILALLCTIAVSILTIHSTFSPPPQPAFLKEKADLATV